MRRLEDALHDLAEQDERLDTRALITRIEQHLNDEADAIVVSLPRSPTNDVPQPMPLRPWPRWAVAFAGALVIVTIAIGLPSLLFLTGETEQVGSTTPGVPPATSIPDSQTTSVPDVDPTTVSLDGVPANTTQWIEAGRSVTQFNPTDGTVDDWFGWSVAVDGDRVVVGSPFSGAYAGTAYVFEHNETSGWLETRLDPSDLEPGGQFGMSAAVDGNRVVVGQPFDREARGAAYLFERNGDGAWMETRLTASDGAEGDVFGSSVAVDGARVVVGAGGDDDDSGAVYIYQPDDTGEWRETKLVASDRAPGDHLGFEPDRSVGIPVAADGGRIVVGSRPFGGESTVYLFETDATGQWTETKLANYGFGVALDGDRVVIGDESSVHVFTPLGSGGWSEATVPLPDRSAQDHVLRMTQSKGSPVAATEGRIVFAAFPATSAEDGDATGSGQQVGPVFMFVPEGDEWSAAQIDVNPHNDIVGFVFAVAANGDRVVVGSPGQFGSAYLYEPVRNYNPL